MEFQAGEVHIAHAGGCVQTAEDKAEPAGVFRLNSRNRSGGEEPFDSLVSKLATLVSVTYMVTGRNQGHDA